MIDELTADLESSTLHVHWSTARSSHAVVRCADWSGGLSCLDADGDAELPHLCPYQNLTALHVFSFDGAAPRPIQDGLGTVRVWHQGGDYRTGAPRSPVSMPSGKHAVYTSTEPVITVETSAGSEALLDGNNVQIDLASDPLDLRLELEVNGGGPLDQPSLRYVAEGVVDTLTWVDERVTPAIRCTGTTPHVAPSTPIVLGGPDGTVLAMTMPPVTMTCDSGATMTLGFEMDWNLGVVLRPI